ncbi:hypothetical protein [Peterkaempfera griseoplana]|uniref:hypothetical protein n=1 Tax=Peterkaempfera griseoplana TaxID=66896 RepID=UPI000B106B06|nr:hypothetical protein [Peterkaempfera griseoplana]
MQLIFVPIEPIQEIAAEPATLDLLTAALRERLPELPAAPAWFGSVGLLTGIPLVAEPGLPPGIVYGRPHPDHTAEPVSDVAAAVLGSVVTPVPDRLGRRSQRARADAAAGAQPGPAVKNGRAPTCGSGPERQRVGDVTW